MPIERNKDAQKNALRQVAATTSPMHSGQDCGTIPFTARSFYHIRILIASSISTFAIFLCIVHNGEPHKK